MSKYNYRMRGARIRGARSRQASVKEKKTWTKFLSGKKKNTLGRETLERTGLDGKITKLILQLSGSVDLIYVAQDTIGVV